FDHHGAAGGAVDALHHGAGDNAEALGFEDALELGGDLRFFGGGDAAGGFEDGDGRTEAAERLPEFEADGATADDGETGRQCGHGEEIAVGEGAGFGEAGDVRQAGGGAGGDDHVLRAQGCAIDLHFVRGAEDGLAPEERDTVFFEAAVGVGAADEVLGRLDAGDDALPAGILRSFRDVDERFGGHATIVQAFAAEVLRLDDGDARAAPPEGTRDVVARGAVADDDEVELVHQPSLAPAGPPRCARTDALRGGRRASG